MKRTSFLALVVLLITSVGSAMAQEIERNLAREKPRVRDALLFPQPSLDQTTRRSVLRPTSERDPSDGACLVNQVCKCDEQRCGYFFGVWSCWCAGSEYCDRKDGKYCTYYYVNTDLKCDTLEESECD